MKDDSVISICMATVSGIASFYHNVVSVAICHLAPIIAEKIQFSGIFHALRFLCGYPVPCAI